MIIWPNYPMELTYTKPHMVEDIVATSTRHVDEVRNINRELTEKALHIRCLSYLSQIKAQLLTETIFEID